MLDSENEELRKHPALGKTLKSFRKRVKMSQQEVVDQVNNLGGNLSHAWYSKIETRKGSYPSQDNFEYILQAIGSDKQELKETLAEEEPAAPEFRNSVFLSSSNLRSNTLDLNYARELTPDLNKISGGFQDSSSGTLAASEDIFLAEEAEPVYVAVAAASFDKTQDDLNQVFEQLNSGNKKATLAYARSLLNSQSRSEE